MDAFVLRHCVKTDDLAGEPRWPDAARGTARPAGARRARAADAPRRARSARSTSTASARAPGTRARSPRSRPTTPCSRRASAESLLAQRHDAIVGQLQFALDSRVTIERAIGLLMGRDGIDGADRLQRAAAGGAQLAPARERRRRGGARRAPRGDGLRDPTRRRSLGSASAAGRRSARPGRRRLGSAGSTSSTERLHAHGSSHERLDEREREQQAAREREDRERRRPARERAVGEDVARRGRSATTGVPERWAQIATASSVHGRKAPRSIGTLSRTPGRRMPPSW